MASSGLRRIVPPSPPANLSSIDLGATTNSSISFFRVSHRSYSSPLFFSRKGIFRFDSPAAKWGVCYLAEEIDSAVLEVFADQIRKRVLPFSDLDERLVWRIDVPRGLHLLELSGPTLPKVKATLQCFVSGFTLSQAWGRALMEHPEDLDGLFYHGRQSGKRCLALFGDTDPAAGRWHQKAGTASVNATALGKLTEWDGFYAFLDQAGVRVCNLPSNPPAQMWHLP